ncbi:hypothetical protein L1887_50197 [Cichorium endivia]|nr:hypothetical protein L1887_50197 [Cichorium endivia]
MLDVASISSSMARLHSPDQGWPDASTQLISSRLEQGARHISPLNATLDPASSPSSSSSRWPESSLRTASASASEAALPQPPTRLERAESFMSTATVSSGILASATISKASTATVRKVERTAAAARPVRITKSKRDVDNITPSSSLDRLSSRSTDATEYQSSPISVADQSHTTVTTSFDATLRSPAFAAAKRSSPNQSLALDLVEPKSFFSDSFSADESIRSQSASASRLPSFSSESLHVGSNPSTSRRGSDQHANDMGTTDRHASEMSHSSSYQSAVSSLAHSSERSKPQVTPPSSNASRAPSNAPRFGLGIQTRTTPASNQIHHQVAPSLEVVPEARESPYLGSRASQAASTPRLGGPSEPLTISTSLPPNSEPTWGQSYAPLDNMAGSLASFSFPSPAPSSAFPSSTSNKLGLAASLSATKPSSRSPASAFHSSNPSIQSFASNAHPTPFASSLKANDAGFLHASGWKHAPPSSYAGSVISSVGAPSTFGLSNLAPANRDDMLQRLLLDQTRVDCQDYGTMSLEQVAEAKRELKHVERKVQNLRSKLKVEIKIRDAAVALRKAHRRTAASPHSPTSSISLAVSPTSPGFSSAPAASSSAAPPLSATSSSFSFAARSRALSVSASEAKADEDVILATAKVIEEKLPFLTTSASFESLAPSASASAVGLSRYRDAGHRYQPSADEPYVPRGPQDPLRHNRLESDLSAISGFSFLDASAPDKLRRLGEELERKREVVRKLEQDLSASRDATQRRDETSDRLTQQLEEQSRERASAVGELRSLQEQLRKHEETAREAQATAVRAAVAEVEQRMHKQIEQSRSRDLEKEDALVNAKAESMASTRAVAELQSRLDTKDDEIKALRTRVDAAERTAEEHKRTLTDVQKESTRQLSQGNQGLASLQAELQDARKAHDAANTLASSRASAIVELEKKLEQVRTELDAEKQARATVDKQLSEAQKQATQSRSRADDADSKLKELELAVGAERRIMAERDELFHAFERRLESAEQRLQESDKRCARMLGKHEGREEMDDLLEMIKKGASGVAKKKKTAGQDIAALLSRPGDTSWRSRAGTCPSEHAQLVAREHGSVGYLLAGKTQAKPSPVDTEKVRRLEAEVRSLTEQKDNCKRQGEERATQLEEELRALGEQIDSLERQRRKEVEQLESKLGDLEALKRELEKKLQNATIVASPSTSTDAAPVRMSKGVSPMVSTVTVPLPKKGVGNLIDRFGGGRKTSSEMRPEDEAATLQACLRSVEALRALLPDLSAAAKGSADLHALREAFEARDAPLPSSTVSRSPSSTRMALGATELQSELEAATERIRSTMAISRAVIDLALESGSGKQQQGTETQSNGAASQKQAEGAGVQQALVSRAELAEAREQLEVARSALRAPPSPSGVGAGERLDAWPLDVSGQGRRVERVQPAEEHRTRGIEQVDTLAVRGQGEPKSRGRATAAGECIARAALVRRPGWTCWPSPTRSNYSAMSSPSIRYISPFAAPGSDARPPARAAPDTAPRGWSGCQCGQQLECGWFGPGRGVGLDVVALRQQSELDAPWAAEFGDECGGHVAVVVLGAARWRGEGASAAGASGMIKRTITLGMDVPQLVERVRELERQLAHTASIRQRAERAGELEAQLRDANHAYAVLIERMDAERRNDANRKVEILNELTDAQSRLCATQRGQALSPLASPMGPAQAVASRPRTEWISRNFCTLYTTHLH